MRTENAIAMVLITSYKALTRPAVASAQARVVNSFPNVLPWLNRLFRSTREQSCLFSLLSLSRPLRCGLHGFHADSKTICMTMTRPSS